MNFTWKLIRSHSAANDFSVGPDGVTTSSHHLFDSDPIVHNTFLHLQLCRVHQRVVGDLSRHLSDHHSDLSLTRRRQIIAAHSQDIVIAFEDFQVPSAPIAPLPELAPPVEALRCTAPACSKIYASFNRMRQHANHQHQWRKCSRQPPPWESVWAQNLVYRGSHGNYIHVQNPHPVAETQEVSSSDPLIEDDHEDGEVELRRLLLIHDRAPALDDEVDYNHDSDWLRACGWPRWFTSKPLVVITSATALPTVSPTSDLFLGHWHDVSCVSPTKDEQCLRRLVLATNLVLQRCETTARDTNRLFRCWLRSWGPSFLAVPFELPKQESSRQRYHSYWRKLVCYIFRAVRVSERLKERTQDIFGFSLSSLQVQAVHYLWREFSQLDTPLSPTALDQDIPPPLLEHLFQFFVMLWTESVDFDVLERNPVIHFSGVLGIHPHDLVYRRAYDYTPYLAALIWLGRLMMLEYALPLLPYRHLPHIWPQRTAYPDQLARLREDIRPRFLMRGSSSPIGYLIERLQHGRAIARRDGCKAQISWSADNQLLRINDTEVRMSQFRAIVHGSIVRAHQQTQDLLFGWWPDIKLGDIQDDLICARPGYSFVQHGHNRLQYGYRVLKQRAFIDTKTLSWTGIGRLKALQYLRACDRLLDFLYGGIHMTSGMPARCEELRTICWANTATSLRNVFVHQGQVILVFAYNKAITHHNNAFYVVRTPCPMMQTLLFIYLTYIRPFRDYVSHQLKLTSFDHSNPHVFTPYAEAVKCFPAARCLRSLQRSSCDAPFQLNTALYRQIAVSIAKKHLPRLVQPFDAYIPQDQTGLLRLLAYQTGHQPRTQAHNYAIDQNYPSRLQPELIERYDANSRLWHEFHMIRKEDIIDMNVDHSGSSFTDITGPPTLRPTEYDLEIDPTTASDLDHEDEEDESSEDSEPIVARRSIRRAVISPRYSDQGRHRARNTRRRPPQDITTSTPSLKRTRQESSESPDSKRIKCIQAELADMLQARKRRMNNRMDC